MLCGYVVIKCLCFCKEKNRAATATKPTATARLAHRRWLFIPINCWLSLWDLCNKEKSQRLKDLRFRNYDL